MSGPTTLRSHKALLTRFRKALAEAIAHCTTVLSGEISSKSLAIESTALRENIQLVTRALDNFTQTVDGMEDPLSEEQEKQINNYMEEAQSTIVEGESLLIKIEAERVGLQQLTRIDGGTRPLETRRTVAELPEIPIPTFDGKISEYENFWALFEANVHSQDLTGLQKFNYLLKALRGSARDAIKRYPITEENYMPALELLRSKFGDKDKLVRSLQTRLETAYARNNQIAEQRRLLEYLFSIVTQLEQNGVTLSGSYVTQKVLAKFQPDLQRRFLKQRITQDNSEHQWSVKNLLSELDALIKTEERVAEMLQDNDFFKSETQRRALPRLHGTMASQKRDIRQNQCIYCKGTEHNSLRCPKVISAKQRREFLKEHKLCMNCGKPNHFVRECLRTGCAKCDGEKHHFSLCPKRLLIGPSTPELPPQMVKKGSQTVQHPHREAAKKPRSPSKATTQCAQSGTSVDEVLSIATPDPRGGTEWNMESHVFLLTGVAFIKNAETGNLHEVQVLLDTGADRSFIEEKLADQLKLPTVGTIDLSLYTFGEKTPRTITYALTTSQLLDERGTFFDLSLCKTETISGKSTHVTLSDDDLCYLKRERIKLPKILGKSPRTPQILLGCDQLWELLDFSSNPHILPSGLRAIPSKLGYLISGRKANGNVVRKGPSTSMHIKSTSIEDEEEISFSTNKELDQWDQYWSMDSAGVEEYLGPTKIEKASVAAKVQKFFDTTIQKRGDGYYVRLPFKENSSILPNNYALALRRLYSTLQTLQSNPSLLCEYDSIFKDQLSKGIIEELPNDDDSGSTVVHYLPHRAVVTPHKETTKVRVVFDASAHYKKCPPLNEVLYQGATLLPELYGMLLRFRMTPFVAIADVEKAFLQVRLQECDRNATRFLWVKDTARLPEDDNLVIYRFTRVTFGLNASPFLLASTIRFHLSHHVQNLSLAKEICDNLYVDNLILSGSSLEEIARKCQEAHEIFQDMHMNLREFLSNGPLQHLLNSSIYSSSPIQKVLGVVWNSSEDVIYQSCVFPTTETTTKRNITKQIASIYDPLGWMVPLMVRAKHFQQQLWKKGCDWDQKLSDEQKQQWDRIVLESTGFARSCPRFINNSSDCSIVVFSDASEIAMCACAYLVANKSSTLLMAKSKLPSIKSKMTIPKMEINALTLGARLALSALKSLQEVITIKNVVLFSDSQIALAWIRAAKNANDLGVFVTNRVKEIESIMTAISSLGSRPQFSYIMTDKNPADAGTRGLSKEHLVNHMWWTGPPFLSMPFEQWEVSPFEIPLGEVSSANMLSSTMNSNEFFPWDRYSTFTKAQRVMAWVLRFLRKTMRRMSRDRLERIWENLPELRELRSTPTGTISGLDMRQAKVALIRSHQKTWSNEYVKSMDNTLKLYKDEQGIWHARGRLGLSSLDDNVKFPIFLAPNSGIAHAIIRQAHGKYHCSIPQTMCNVRQEYWIPRLRQQVRKMISHCTPCRRFNGSPYKYPPMPDLPLRRVQECHPFQHIGLDFFDLPEVQDQQVTCKAYGCIFTCAVTRLIHIEVVRSMNTEAFINALRRFFARRGVPESITCDNAPTFLLSAGILRSACEMADLESWVPIIPNQDIEWRYITPYSPWQGGFYERLIQSIKHSLYKAIGRAKLTVDELQTVITEIEGSLNCRPLTYQESDLQNIVPLRPIDFIQKGIVITYPFENISTDENDPDFEPSTISAALRTRHEAEQALRSSVAATQRFWKVWKDHYLVSLREQHRKWIASTKGCTSLPRKNAIVLVTDPLLPRNLWKMARITDVKVGKDGAIREVELLTSSGRKMKRPINMIVPLELEHEADEAEEQRLPDQAQEDATAQGRSSYNLRPRKQVRFNF